MNTIHPSVVIDGAVEIGSGNVIGPGVIIQGPAIIGDNNYIGPGVSIGSISRERLEPSHRLADPMPLEVSTVVIGNSAMIFDHAVISKPMFEKTSIGDHVEIGAQTFVAHDCVIRAHAILSPHVALGAYATIGSGANLGLASAVHNRLTIGGLAMCGAASVIVGHVPVGAMVYGNPARIRGPNSIGLIRAGFLDSDVESVREYLNESIVEFDNNIRQLVEQYMADLQKWPTSKKEVQWET